MKNAFSNNNVFLENIPQTENVDYSTLEKKYLNVMVLNRVIWCVITIIALIAIPILRDDNFSIYIYLSSLLIWLIIFTFTGFSFNLGGLSLQENETYYGTIYALDKVGNESLRVSEGLTIDRTGPEDGIVADGQNFVAGGDLNALPTNASKLDYCLEDQCENESYHSDKEVLFERPIL